MSDLVSLHVQIDALAITIREKRDFLARLEVRGERSESERRLIAIRVRQLRAAFHTLRAIEAALRAGQELPFAVAFDPAHSGEAAA